MNSCPCCSNQLLRHIRHQKLYWFCTSCWQEMPILDSSLKKHRSPLRSPLKQPNKTQIFSPAIAQAKTLSSTAKTL